MGEGAAEAYRTTAPAITTAPTARAMTAGLKLHKPCRLSTSHPRTGNYADDLQPYGSGYHHACETQNHGGEPQAIKSLATTCHEMDEKGHTLRRPRLPESPP